MFEPSSLKTYTVNLNAGGNADIVAAAAGIRWGIIVMVLTADTANTTVTIDSGTTEIASIRLPQYGQLVIGDGNSILLLANATNEKLNIEATTGAVDGFVQVVTLRTG